jgi:hypothetical protein
MLASFIMTYNKRTGIVTGYKLGRFGARTPEGEDSLSFAPVQTDPGAHPASCTGVGCLSSGVKRPGRGVDHPPLSRVEVKEKVELYLYFPHACIANYRGTFTFLQAA